MLIINRRKLDEELAKTAISKGVKIKFNHQVENYSLKRNKTIGCKGKTKKDRWNANSPVTVCAEGNQSRILQKTGFKTTNLSWRLPAVQYELKNAEINRNRVELYFGSKWAPGFFAWIIPTGTGYARVGVATVRHPHHQLRKILNNFVNKHPIASQKLHGAKIDTIRGGFVPVGGPLSQSVYDGFLIVGDAAGQAKATTGGGVNIGGHCARIAGVVISECLEKKRFDKLSLTKYDTLWHQYYFRELLLMSLFRRSITTVSDKMLNQLFSKLKKIDFERELRRVEDVDLHAVTITLNLLRPSFLKQAFLGLPHLIRGFFSVFSDFWG